MNKMVKKWLNQTQKPLKRRVKNYLMTHPTTYAIVHVDQKVLLNAPHFVMAKSSKAKNEVNNGLWEKDRKKTVKANISFE